MTNTTSSHSLFGKNTNYSKINIILCCVILVLILLESEWTSQWIPKHITTTIQTTNSIKSSNFFDKNTMKKNLSAVLSQASKSFSMPTHNYNSQILITKPNVDITNNTIATNMQANINSKTNKIAFDNNSTINTTTTTTTTNRTNHTVWIFNVDSRSIDPSSIMNQTLTKDNFYIISTALNSYYASIFDYKYVYLQPKKYCSSLLLKNNPKNEKNIKWKCPKFDNNGTLSIQWVKVVGILYMIENIMFENDLAMFIDTDVNFRFEKEYFQSINEYFFNKLPSMLYNNYISNISTSKKMSFVKDSHSYWTSVSDSNNFTRNYAINSGIIFFYKCEITHVFMQEWYQSMSNIETPLEKSLHVDYTKNWPFEQGKLTYMIATKVFSQHIDYMYRNLEFVTHWGLIHERSRYTTDYSIKTLIDLCRNDKFIQFGQSFQCNNRTNYTLNSDIIRKLMNVLIQKLVTVIEF